MAEQNQKITDDTKYITPLLLKPMITDDFYGLGISNDNGVTWKPYYGPGGRIYYQEDAERLWPFFTDKIKTALSLDWNDIQNKPLLVTSDELEHRLGQLPTPTINWADITNKPVIPSTDGLAKQNDLDSVKTTADSALSKAEQAQSTADANAQSLQDKANRSEIPTTMSWNQVTDKPDLATKNDIPSVSGLVKETELSDYAKKSDLPKAPDLSGYATLASLNDYAKKTDVPTTMDWDKVTDKPTDLVHTADMDSYVTNQISPVSTTANSAKTTASMALSNAQTAINIANSARTAIDSTKPKIDSSSIDDNYTPSHYDDGVYYELKNVNYLGVFRDDLDSTAQTGSYGILVSHSVAINSTRYVRQSFEIIDSDRPITFMRNGVNGEWHDWEVNTTLAF